MKEKVKELRVRIDGLGQLAKGLRVQASLGKYNPNPFNSKECEKATDSLFLAKAWLGKVLGALGEDSPYPKDGTRKTVKDIEPTADTHNPPKKGCSFEVDWSSKSHIEKVDWLRQEISKVVKEVLILRKKVYENDWGYELQLYIAFAIQYLSEARFHLGFELERVREDDK